MGGDVIGGHGAEVHGGGRLVPSETPKADTMPGVLGGTHCRFHDVTPLPHAQDQSRNQLEVAAGQPDITPTPGVRRELTADNETVPLPLPWMPGILPHVDGLHSHFNRQHWGDRISILEEHPNPIPRCERCRSQVPEVSLSNRHYT